MINEIRLDTKTTPRTERSHGPGKAVPPLVIKALLLHAPITGRSLAIQHRRKSPGASRSNPTCLHLSPSNSVWRIIQLELSYVSLDEFGVPTLTG